ncbi:cysteine-rich receptor-like protein kinase 25 [Silene latifolia]|uniref:cysteine-rich receptor-like protein kinase 25 n=1 Tax=Silene latifolia TaxID=37657 RepID=UPI003D785B3A
MVTLCSMLRLSLFLLLNLLILLSDLNQITANNSETSQPYVYSICNDTDPVAPNSVYQANINSTLSFLASNSSTTTSRFYNTTVGTGSNKIYGIYFCRLDVTNAVCQQCVSPATDAMKIQCRRQKDAVLWYSDKCMVRYSNKPFLGTMHETPMIAMWNRQNSLNIWDVTSNMPGFNQVLLSTLDEGANQATSGPTDKMFATREGIFAEDLMNLNTIYTLLECSPDITLNDCKNCLQATIGNISDLCNKKAGCTLMCLNCNIRYDTYPFYGDALLVDSPTPSPSPNFKGTGQRVHSNNRSLVIGFSAAAAVVTVIIAGLLKFLWSREIEKPHNDCNDIETVENLKFDFNLIRTATNNFSSDQKLGEGGFGQVFKGKLLSGEEIAVKRLSRNSRQGVKEFKTEAYIVAKLQHKNLVKLLGFCTSKQEKLLIYEFCMNSSLDKLLFDALKCQSLNWNTRFKIICGIARGLLYLHEDSRLKIIHRDLKASNVLLDNDMNPKISDFGMARLFGADETQGNTNKIAGTFGYMAPEYVIAGQYSAKSDVYSFGIIILEIVSGQRNKFSRTDNHEESLLERAWRLWNEKHTMELVDQTMGNNFTQEEAAKCIHIGLLCIQEDAARRPGMTSVASALNGDAIVLPSPAPPHIFMTGSFGFEEPRTSQSSKTFSGSKNITVLEAR